MVLELARSVTVATVSNYPSEMKTLAHLQSSGLAFTHDCLR